MVNGKCSTLLLTIQFQSEAGRDNCSYQSNGKIERWHKSLKGECIRPGTPPSLEDARRRVKGYVEHYNDIHLNSAVGYITPKDMLAGHQPGDSGRPGSEIGGGEGTAEESPPAGRVTNETDYFRCANDSDGIASPLLYLPDPSGQFMTERRGRRTAAPRGIRSTDPRPLGIGGP